MNWIETEIDRLGKGPGMAVYMQMWDLKIF